MQLRIYRLKNYLTPVLVLAILVDCQPAATNGNSDSIRDITILYTNDEHGWMEGVETGRGAAEIMGLWETVEGYKPNSSYLILSGGDMWTGPAISTWFEGESMVEVLNTMGYTAAAIGNHEFDFKVETLRLRLAESDFPYLSANIRTVDGNTVPDFARPYLITTVNGLKIAIIGLTTTSTPWTAFPDYVEDFAFIDYTVALDDVLPAVRDEGPDLIIIISHVCFGELQDLSGYARNNGITLLGGGHCHAEEREVSGGLGIVEAGRYLEAYARIDISYDLDANRVTAITIANKQNRNGTADTDISTVVSSWRARSDDVLAEVIGFTQNGLEQHSDAMYNLVPDAWLWQYPGSEAAATNYGGYRQDLIPGDITIADIVGVLPFINTLYILDLTGQQLINFASGRNVATGGITAAGTVRFLNGATVNPDSVYQIIVTDFMYSVYDELPDADGSPIQTGVLWRQPVIDWIKSKESTSANPLDGYLDPIPRR